MDVRKVLNVAAPIIAGIFAVLIIYVVGLTAVSALNDSFGTNVRDGITTCPVSSMSVDYAIDKPPKTQWVRLRCDEGTWGFAWLSERASDGWRQPQEVLDQVKISDAFNCARYRKLAWTGKQQYFHYRDCELKS